MEHCVVTVTMLLVWQWKSILATGTCYSSNTFRKNWKESNQYCQQNGGKLVSMESEDEYQFINKTIQSLDVEDNEWYIGLRSSIGGWKWTSGQVYHKDKFTNKLAPGEPFGDGDCVKMIKEYRGHGLLINVKCRLDYMFICEYKADLAVSPGERKSCPETITEKTTKKRECNGARLKWPALGQPRLEFLPLQLQLKQTTKNCQYLTRSPTKTTFGFIAQSGHLAASSFTQATKSEILFATGTDYCSCYSFHKIMKTWDESKEYCKRNGGNLVSMETEEEYQFINKTIQSLDVSDNNEWHIGLRKQPGGWVWISGQTYTLTDKWVSNQDIIPGGNENCVKMIKSYKGLGLFDDIKCRLQELIICENKTGHTCPTNIEHTVIYEEVWCSSNDLTTTTADYSTTTTSSSTRKETTTTTTTTATPTRAAKTAQRTPLYSSPPTEKKSTTINGQQTDPFTNTNTNTKPEAHVSSSTEKSRTIRPTQDTGDANKRPSKTSDSGSFPLEIVTVSLGVVLAVVVCLLLFVCYWKRRNKGDKSEKPISETTGLPRGATRQSSTNNQATENSGFPEGVQLFNENAGEPYVTYAVIHNNLAQQNQGPTASNEPAYASIQDESLMNRSSKKNDSNAVMPAAMTNASENSGNSVRESNSYTEVMYASVDKSKKNNEKNGSQKSTQCPSGQQAVYASVDKSKKSKPQAEDAVYAEVGNKANTEKPLQPLQITYAELADLNQNRTPDEVVKPAPYQPAEYAVIVGQKQKS